METEKEVDNIYGLALPPVEAHYTVYKLTDPDGKIYIGCTGQAVEKRWREGKGYAHDTPIGRAIEEIGWENYKKEILCERLMKEGAEKLERWFIAFYDSSDPSKGYNRFLGGLGKGVRMSEVSKAICRESKNRLYEQHPELKDRIRDTVTTLYRTDPDYRRRIGATSKEHWQDPVFREKVVASIRKKREDPEMSRKFSLRAKEFYEQHPESRERIRRQMREYLSKPENRAFAECDRRAKPVVCVETGEFYPSLTAAEKKTGHYGIHKACSGVQMTSGGCHWRYAEQEG